MYPDFYLYFQFLTGLKNSYVSNHHFICVLKEIYVGSIDLRKPKQIPVFAKTDSKSLWESLNNTRQCEEKLMRSTIAGIKELVDLGYVSSIDWVSTENETQTMIHEMKIFYETPVKC